LRSALSSRGRALSQRYSLDAMVDQFAALIAATTGTVTNGR